MVCAVSKMRNLGRIIQSYNQQLIWQKRSASLFCGRPLSSKSSSPQVSSKSSEAATRNSCWASSQPCLVLPPAYARGGEVKDDTDDEKENDRCYYSYYSLEEKKVVRVKDEDDDTDNSSSRKRILHPWERDMLLPKDAICVGSSHGWVAYLNPREDCSLYLFKHPPLSSPDFFTSGMFRFPPLQTHPRISAVLTSKTPSHPDRRPDDSPPVTRDYFCWGSGSESDFDGDMADFIPTQHARSPYDIAECFLDMLVLSRAPSPSSTPSLSLTPVVDTSGCIALALLGGNFAFCRLGDPEWTPLKASCNYSDLIYSSKNRCFHGLVDDRAGSLDCIDFSDPSSPQIYILRPSGAHTRNGLKSIESFDLVHLVESSGEILMIRGIIGNDRLPDQIHVYKLDYAKQAWKSVKCIGDHALFVGPKNHSFSLSTLDFPHLKPNSIYFIHAMPTREEYDPDGYRHHIGVFSMEDNTFEQCCTFVDAKIIYPSHELPLWVAPSNN